MFHVIPQCQDSKITKHRRTNKTLGIRTQSKNNRWLNTQSHTPVCSTQRFCLCCRGQSPHNPHRRLPANWNLVSLSQREALVGVSKWGRERHVQVVNTQASEREVLSQEELSVPEPPSPALSLPLLWKVSLSSPPETTQWFPFS